MPYMICDINDMCSFVDSSGVKHEGHHDITVLNTGSKH